MRPKGTLKIILEKPTKLESICFYGNSAFNTKGLTNNTTGFAATARNLFFLSKNVASMTVPLSSHPPFSLKDGVFQQIQ